MATGTAGLAAQELPFCAVNYSRRPIAYNTPGLLTALTFVVGALPAGSFIRETIIRVTTAFNDSGTDTLKVGHSDDDDVLSETGDSDLTTAGTYLIARGAGTTIAAARNFYALYTAQNSDPSAGVGYVIIVHMPNIDKLA